MDTGRKLDGTNEEQSRRRLKNMKLRLKDQIKAEYTHIVEEQLEEGIAERIPWKLSGKRAFYLPHKPVIPTEAVTTKARLVIDACAKPHHLTASINESMYTGPSLQPLLWDIMIRSRMSENLLLGDIKKAFLQIGIKEEVCWKDLWLQTNLSRRLSTDTEVTPTCSLTDQTFGSGQHYGRNKKRMVDSKTKIESEENGQHVQRLQGFQHETLWSYSKSRHATVLRGSQQTF